MDQTADFQQTLQQHAQKHYRDLPWRRPIVNGQIDPYKVLVSEIMLQQTQVTRAIPKYEAFLQAFASAEDLAVAPLSEVLAIWSGLGYNRRAKYLQEAAIRLAGKQTWTLENLLECKGIGYNTAAAVCVYAYNQPRLFIETNIRTVFIYHFFADESMVADKDILPLLDVTLDRQQPRQFYWALMDYGAYLKKTVGNRSRQSRHYARQSRFEGSRRQLRGQILKLLLTGSMSPRRLGQLIADPRLPDAVDALLKEGLIIQERQQLSVPQTNAAYDKISP